MKDHDYLKPQDGFLTNCAAAILFIMLILFMIALIIVMIVVAAFCSLGRAVGRLFGIRCCQHSQEDIQIVKLH